VNALPVTEKSAASVLSLPMYPELTEQEVRRVVEEILAWETGQKQLSAVGKSAQR